MEHFNTFYTSDIFMQMRTFRDITQKRQSNVLTVLYGNKYVVGLFTFKLACVIVTFHC